MIDAGTQLGGKYRIVRRIGEGSMGTVYEAEHARIGRRVAIKLLHERYNRNARAIERFLHEARAAGAVGHDNIVEATDFGTHKGLPFIVMELLRGDALAERLAHERRVPPREAVRIAAQMLSALASAHAVGIVHRDLKPENVFLMQRGANRDVVKLLDFGLSKFRRSDGSSRIETQDGVLMGTPAYMAPEQWMGRRDTDHRADLFAVGVVLYEMLTGKLPFQGETQGELFQNIVNGTDEPAAPSTLRPEIPAALDAVVLRAIRRIRDDRFESAKSFLDALHPFGAEDITAVDAPPASLQVEGHDDTVRLRLSTRAESVDRRRRPLRWTRILPGVLVPAALAALLFATVGVPRWSRRGAGTTASAVRPAAPVTPLPQIQSPLTALVVAPASPDGAAREESADIRVELRGLPSNATVRMEGILQEGTTLQIARGTAARTIEVQSGIARRTLEIVPDHDQVVFVDAASLATVSVRHDASVPPSSGAAGSGVTGRAGSGTTRPRGIGAIGVSHQF